MKFNKKNSIILSLFLAFFLTIIITPTFVTARTQKVVAAMDAFVLDGSPDNNYGLHQLIFAGEMESPAGFGVSGNPGYCETYLYFDLSTLSNNIEKAELLVTGAAGPYDGDRKSVV